ncbi:hypothetical protein NN561_018812 [Cricetulus griseus]
MPMPSLDPGLAYGCRPIPGPWRVEACCRIGFRRSHHWCQMTLISDDEWNQKELLDYLDQQMDRELHCATAFQSPLPNVDPGLADKHTTATVPWRVIFCRHTRILGQHIDANYHWVWASWSPTQKSDPVSEDGGRTTTWPRHVRTRHSTWIQSTGNWCQMTLSSDDQWNQKQPLTFMALQLDTELPLGLRVLYTATEL